MATDNPYYSYRHHVCDCSVVLNTDKGINEISHMLGESKNFLPDGVFSRVPMTKLINLKTSGDILLGSMGTAGEIAHAIILDYDYKQISKIAKKYDYELIMWGDMFFRLLGADYDATTDKIPPAEITALIPDNVNLVYWDYYSKDYMNLIF